MREWESETILQAPGKVPIVTFIENTLATPISKASAHAHTHGSKQGKT